MGANQHRPASAQSTSMKPSLSYTVTRKTSPNAIVDPQLPHSATLGHLVTSFHATTPKQQTLDTSYTTTTSQPPPPQQQTGCAAAAHHHFSLRKCFATSSSRSPTNHQSLGLGQRLVNKWRRSLLKTSRTQLENFADSKLQHRSTTDQNLFLIKDNFAQGLDDEHVDDHCYDDDEQQSIDSDFLRNVNQKLRCIQDAAEEEDDEEDDNFREKAVLPKTKRKQLLPKSPACFNIHDIGDDVNKVKDLLQSETLSCYEDDQEEEEDHNSLSSSFSGAGEHDELNEKRSPRCSMSSSVSVSTVSSFRSSSIASSAHTPVAKTATKNPLRRLLPAFTCKLLCRKAAEHACVTTTGEVGEAVVTAERERTEAEMFSFRERFEIRDLPLLVNEDADEEDGIDFIDEEASSSCTASSSGSSLFAVQASNISPPPHPHTPHREVAGFFSQVNRKLQSYRHKKRPIPTKCTHHRHLDSVSAQVEAAAAICDEGTIEKILNKEILSNDNKDDEDQLEVEFTMFGGTMVEKSHVLGTVVAPVTTAGRILSNDASSIVLLKVNAPLASSERTTPLSRSIDYLNRLDQLAVNRGQSGPMPIKKYYRLSNTFNNALNR